MKRLWMMAAALVVCASCSVESTSTSMPGPTGPSELGLSLTITATPDVIRQDGVAVSSIQVQARDSQALPVAGVSVRLDLLANGKTLDFGALSSRTVTTGTDGRATATYLSPGPPPADAQSDVFVTIVATPIGTNFANAQSRYVEIRLARPGVILPPNGTPQPSFFASPISTREDEPVTFDASASRDDGQIVSWAWKFGDGDTGSGRQITHTYDLAGTYQVTLTVTDDKGLSASTAPTPYTVTTAANPVAAFTYSPTGPRVGTAVVFNAAASTAPTGRRIVSYNWDLGDQTFVSGVALAHTYQAAGQYTVVLTVTDDTGRKHVKSETITVTDLQSPTASFTVSPTDPQVNQAVFFNAAASVAAVGRAIVRYQWDFGDGSPGAEGVTAQRAFALARTYTVVLTVTDDAGGKSVVTQTVTVEGPLNVLEDVQ